jgi:predicted metalloprotease with PDZ domain
MPVHYRVTAPRPGTHRFHVEASYPAGATELVFASWAPGSYLMREFARNVGDVRAHRDGVEVPVEKTSRNTWRVDTDGPFTVEYDVYAREKSVRTPFCDEELRFFLPSNLLAHPTVPATFVMEVEVPAGQVGVCPLGPAVEGPAFARWEAADVDQLHDSPVAVAPFQHTRFEVDGVEHHHWIEPRHDGDVEKMNDDLRKIVVAARDLMGGGLPYPRYDFVTLLASKGHGGLEHKDGCVLLRPRLSLKNPKDYEEFVTLAAHEHFHAWNVKRIHPDTLGPRFDYAREHHTRDLWWLEGGTVYYEERIAYKAGLVSKERHLERLAELGHKVLSIPGRRHQSLEDSSFDAWIKLYRPGEDSGNSTISYYLKGAVVIWAMDLEIRRRTEGKRGTDDILRILWERWGRHGEGYPERVALREVAREVAGADEEWDRWWDWHVKGTNDVSLVEALDAAGYDATWAAPKPGSWLGVEVGERMGVESVREDGPAAGAISPGDEILAIDELRVASPSMLADRLKDAPPDTELTVLLSRDSVILRRAVRTVAQPRGDLKIVERAGIDDGRLLVRSAWAGAPAA